MCTAQPKIIVDVALLYSLSAQNRLFTVIRWMKNHLFSTYLALQPMGVTVMQHQQTITPHITNYSIVEKRSFSFETAESKDELLAIVHKSCEIGNNDRYGF